MAPVHARTSAGATKDSRRAGSPRDAFHAVIGVQPVARRIRHRLEQHAVDNCERRRRERHAEPDHDNHRGGVPGRGTQ